jgi:hypothetical protein
MASNSINLNTTSQGLAALQAMTISGTPLSITKIELSSNLTPNADPNIWDPSGGAVYPNWYIQTTNVTSIKTAPNGSYVFNVQLNETIPLNKLFGATDPDNTQNGWIGTPSDSINIGSFCLFVTNPTTLLTVPLMIGYFSTETVLKFGNLSYMAGNILDLLNQLYFSAFDSSGLTYELIQEIDAQVDNQLTINNIPIPNILSANVYNVTDIQGMAYTDYYKWYFTNYAILIESASFSVPSSNVFTSADLFNALPASLQNIGALPINMLVGEIYDSSGVMKKCFHIISTTGNNFTTSISLPLFAPSDKIICFINENFQYFTPPVPPYVYPTVNTYAATNIINTAMKLNGELISLGDASAVQVGFDYKATYETSWTRTPLVNLTTFPITYSLVVGGLVSNQTYDIRAVAVDMTTFTDTYGAVVTATTSLVPIPNIYAFFNITGATSGVSNTALNSTSIPILTGGSIVANQVVASVDSCVSATFEIAQPISEPTLVQIQPYYTLRPYVLDLSLSSTNTTLIINDSQSGLLYNGVELIVDDAGTMKLITAGVVTQTVNPSGGYTYTCTSLSAPLVVPLWAAKGGQIYQSSCGMTAGSPVYVNDTVQQINRTGAVLVVTMQIRATNGMYVQEQIIINKDDIVSQYGCNLWV